VLTAASVTRQDVTFLSGGEPIAAWFYPGEGDGPARRACVVIGHGFAAVKEARLDAFAERFAAAGLACLVFDYRHFGASGGLPRQVIDIRHQRQDWDAALDYGRSTADRASSISRRSAAACVEVAARDAGSARRCCRSARRLACQPLRDRAHSHARRVRPVGLGVKQRGATRSWCQSSARRARAFDAEAEPGCLSIVRSAPSWRNGRGACGRVDGPLPARCIA
jgi:hypothetical protein